MPLLWLTLKISGGQNQTLGQNIKRRPLHLDVSLSIHEEARHEIFLRQLVLPMKTRNA
jgi:hypothetical protein